MRNLASQPEDLAALFQALELSPDAVFVTDRSNRIVFWNAAARVLLGFTPEEAVGADCDKLLRGCDVFGNRYCSANCPIMQMANRGEVVHTFTMRVRNNEGQTVTIGGTVLQLRSRRPDEYWLAHILTPAEEAEAHAAPEASLPKPLHLVARESSDVRARKLTTREVEVLGMLAAGRTTPEIAERLHIAPLTARSHIQNILEKLEVHSKAEAVAFAFHKNLI